MTIQNKFKKFQFDQQQQIITKCGTKFLANQTTGGEPSWAAVPLKSNMLVFFLTPKKLQTNVSAGSLMSISALEAITSIDPITLRLSILCRRQLNKVIGPSSVLLWRLMTITPQ